MAPATANNKGSSRSIVLLLLGSLLMVGMVAPAQSRRLLDEDDDADEKNSVTWTYLPFIACEDDNLSKIDTGSARACLDECEDAEDCLAFSYNVVDGRCYTKKTQCLDQSQNPDNFSAIKVRA